MSKPGTHGPRYCKLDNMKVTAALLTLLEVGLAAAQTNDTSIPSEVPYYGLSPPVYPARMFLHSALGIMDID